MGEKFIDLEKLKTGKDVEEAIGKLVAYTSKHDNYEYMIRTIIYQNNTYDDEGLIIISYLKDIAESFYLLVSNGEIDNECNYMVHLLNKYYKRK